MEFEPLTFEEFALVFELSVEDIEAINNNEVLKQWITNRIEFANNNPGIVHRAFNKLEDERCNIARCKKFATYLIVKSLKIKRFPDM